MSEVSDRARRQLHALARTKGIEVRWRAQDGSPQTCSDDTLIAVLQLLRVDIQRPEDARRVRAELARQQRETLVEPVVVAWDGAAPVIAIRLPERAAGNDFAIVVDTESNGEARWTRRDLDVRPDSPHTDGGEALLVELPHGFASGRHGLRVELGARHADATLIAAPTRIGNGTRPRAWGVFAPVYALHDRGRSGAGDLGTLDRFAQWTATRDGAVIGTLPILAMFAGHGKEPCEPSPYAPVSRRYWNELYLDLAALPELAGAPDPPAGPAPSRPGRLLDLPGIAAARRPLLETAAARARETPGRRVEIERWLEAHSDLRAYAEFRAATEGSGRAGVSFHEYAQFALAEQLTRLAGSLDERGQSLYIDLPVGTHRDGYDVAARPELFATDATVGAPPDGFQPEGQNWGFPPLDPAAARADGHRYFASCLDEQLRYARLLRLDHVMGLHRLWIIPAGAPATEGAYVRYPADEHWATICMVAQRHDAAIVGENLGTVPPATNRAMHRHRALGIWVAQFEVPDDDGIVEPPGASVLACLDTHDLVTFATWWQGLAPGPRAALLTTLRGAGELASEGDDATAPAAVLAATLAWMGRSRAPIVLATLEDLWLEPESQNIPGSLHQDEAFRRSAAHGIDELDGSRLGHRCTRPTRSRPEQHMTETHDAEYAMTLLTADDLYLFNEGRHYRLYERLGVHEAGAGRYEFAVWAPNASAVSVIGDRNGWHAGTHSLGPVGSSGVWSGTFDEWRPGDHYKFRIDTREGYSVEKADPFAFATERGGGTASVIADLAYDWNDESWMRTRGPRQRHDSAVSIYEVHLGSWRRGTDGYTLPYREVGEKLAQYAHEHGFTHVELLPIMEHPFFGSWGYQTTSYFAPTSRFGDPTDFMHLVDTLHRHEVGVILDWVPSHFPSDEFGLAYFDGTHLFEHADPRQGFHPDWGTLVFNYDRHEVRSFLISSACFWLDRYHADGLRVDAVASMLYLDYSREEGEWIPNQFGGRENLGAVSFLKEMNEEVYRSFPDVQTYAEESTAWPGVSRPTYLDGLGFGAKWDMGWMHDTLQYFALDPIHRQYHHDELTFRAVYAWSENYVLPLSHDEVVHGKGSLAAKMPGDVWQKLANLRLLYGYQWALPGKNLLFMGSELAQWGEWNHDGQVDWHLERLRRARGRPALGRRPEPGAARASGALRARLGTRRLPLDGRRRPGEQHVVVPALRTRRFAAAVRREPHAGDPSRRAHPGAAGRVLERDPEQRRRASTAGRASATSVASKRNPAPVHDYWWSLTLTLPPLGALVLRPDGKPA